MVLSVLIGSADTWSLKDGEIERSLITMHRPVISIPNSQLSFNNILLSSIRALAVLFRVHYLETILQVPGTENYKFWYYLHIFYIVNILFMRMIWDSLSWTFQTLFTSVRNVVRGTTA